MMIWLAVAAGGAIGSLARHATNVVVHRTVGESVPYATAIVNVVGCFTIGALAGLISSGHLRLSESARAFVFVCVLGGFTTFSSFGLDTYTLVRGGAIASAAGNVLGQIVMGLGSVFVGYRLATSL
jgi:CrcB protein